MKQKWNALRPELRLAFLCVLFACAASPASAQRQHAPTIDVRSAPEATRGDFAGHITPTGMLALRRQRNTQLIEPNGQALWAPVGNDPEHSLAPAIAIELVENGANITYTFDNQSDEPKWLGALYIGGIRFDDQVLTRFVQGDGKELALSNEGKAFFGGGGHYPGDLYAPVATLRDDDTTIGVALLYPVLKYKHRVFIRAECPGGPYARDGRNWQVLLHLSPLRAAGPERDIAPGESRTYVVTVRAAEGDPALDWLRTLIPYRDHFQALYGPVRYDRDPRPVRAIEIAGSHPPTDDNPRAFTYEDRRIDRMGWLPWIDAMRSLMDDGFRRFMLIAPTGMYTVHRQNNYPFQFTTGWRSLPRARADLWRLAAFGREVSRGGLGLWWGRSAQVMKTWDTAAFEVLDPANPDHRARALRELDLAALMNTTVVGLDAFSYVPPWDGYAWVTSLRELHPSIKFIVEPLGPDFMHTIAGAYVYGLRDASQQAREPAGPFLLADFLNPGHETWARLDANLLRAKMGLKPGMALDKDLVRAHAERIARWGYIPIVHAPADVQGILAAPTWQTALPIDLRPMVRPSDDDAQQNTGGSDAQ